MTSPTLIRGAASRGAQQMLGGGGAIGGRALVLWAAISMACGGAAAFGHIKWVTSQWDRDMFVGGLKARVPLKPKATVAVPNEYGDGAIFLPKAEAREYTRVVFGRVLKQAERATVTFGVGFVAGFALLLLLAHRLGKKSGNDEFIRGGRLGTRDQVLKDLKKNKRVGSYSIGGVPLLPGRERQHILVVGTTGSGKTVLIKDIMDQVRSRREPALVFDPEGELVADFYDEKTDVILNPFDARAPKWNIWEELERDYQLFALSEALFPPHNAREPFFDEAAQALFQDIVERLREQGDASNARLYEVSTGYDIQTLHAFLDGLPSARHVNPAGEKKSDSILSSFVNKMRLWRYLPDSKAGEGFSIRRFVRDDATSGWVFITATEEQLPIINRLLSLWAAIYVEAILSLPKSSDRRIWTFLDELPALGKIRLQDLLTRGRKRGSCCVIGFQDIAQLEVLYGPHVAQTLRSSCSTWSITRLGDPLTAKQCSEALSHCEVCEVSESVQSSTERVGESYSVNRRRAVRPVVMDAELMHLPDLRGYLRQLGLPVVPIELVPKSRRPSGHTPGFIPRDPATTVEHAKPAMTSNRLLENDADADTSSQPKHVLADVVF